MKKVTETTNLRVSRGTRLGIASCKMLCISTRDRRDNVDVDEIKDVEPCFRMFERMDYTTKQILVVNVRRFTLENPQIFYLSFI